MPSYISHLLSLVSIKCPVPLDSAWPFTDMGWDIGEDISARTYTKNDWFNGPHTMFYFNVEEDKEVLYES